MDFRDWLVAMGREVFEAAMANPESVAAVADPSDPDGWRFFKHSEP